MKNFWLPILLLWVGCGLSVPAFARQQVWKGVDTLLPVQKLAREAKDSLRLMRYVDRLQRSSQSLKDNIPDLKQYLRTPLQNSLQNISGRLIYEDVPAMSGIRWEVQAADQFTVANMPFNISYTNLAATGYTHYLNGGIFKVSFDHEAYVQQLTGKLNTFYDLKKDLLKDLDMEPVIKGYVDRRIRSIHAEMDSLFNTAPASLLPAGMDVDQLIQLDTAQIKHLLTDNNYIPLPPGADTLAAQATTQVQEARNTYLQKILQLKAALDSGEPLKEQMGRYDNIKEQALGFLNRKDNTISNIKQRLPLNALQRLFLHMKTFNIGSFHAATAGSTAVSNLFLRGAAGTFFNKGKSIMAGIGSRFDGVGMKDAAFTENLVANHFAMQFASLGKGDPGKEHTQLTFLNANSRNNDLRQVVQQFLPRNSFVGTFAKQVSVGQHGAISGEFSKSATRFNESVAGPDGYMPANKIAALSFLNDFWQTISAGVNYSDSYDELGLSHKIYVTYSGMGYNNPGAPGAARGSWQYGLQVRHKWKQHNLVTGFKADRKDINTGLAGGWKNQQYAADISWRLKRIGSFTARLLQSSMKSTGQGMPANSFLTRQVTVTSQMNLPIGALPANSMIILGLQQMDFTAAGILNRGLLINASIMENVVINSNVLSISIFYNHDVKQNALFSDMLNADAGWNYTLLKRIACSSGITYLDNKGVVRQAGIKQTAATNLLPRLNASLYIDCRKNLFNTAMNYLYGTFRSELSLQYLIN